MKNFLFILFILTLCLKSAGQDAGHPVFTLTGNGKPLQVNSFTHYAYASVEMSRATDFVLESKKPLLSGEISPLSRGIKHRIEGNKIYFTLTEPGYVMLRINETDKFFVFAEEPERVPDRNVLNILSFGVDNTGLKTQTDLIQKAMDEAAKSGKTLLFPEGTYTAGQLRPLSHTHIHLARGAILQSDISSASQYMSDDRVKTKKFIYIKDAHNVKISGYGAINGNGARMREKFGDEARMRLIMAVNCHNLTIEGIMLRDPGSWNTQLLQCQNVSIRHVKLMNNIDVSNTDGFDPDASQKITISDCFAYCGDDNVAIKTTGTGDYLANAKNITIRGNLFLTKKSSLKIGTETRGAKMRNIVFADNDVIESDRGMAIYNSDGTALKNIRFINNRFERNHPDAKRAGFFFQMNLRNADSKPGKMKNILMKDCHFHTAFPNPSEIAGLDAEHCIENVTIDNLRVAGRKIRSLTDPSFKINSFVRNLTVK